MQKSSAKASILIWAIFLSLIITVTFISISSKINKNLKNNIKLTNNLEVNKQIDDLLKYSLINGIYKNKNLDNGEKIIFDNPNKKYINLKKNETIKLKFNQTNDVTITGSIVYYSGTTSTGIINQTTTFSTGSGFLYLTNLGAYSQLEISSTGTIIEEYMKYKVIKQIGNKIIIKSKGKIKSF